jgi:hypothetical protein
MILCYKFIFPLILGALALTGVYFSAFKVAISDATYLLDNFLDLLILENL